MSHIRHPFPNSINIVAWLLLVSLIVAGFALLLFQLAPHSPFSYVTRGRYAEKPHVSYPPPPAIGVNLEKESLDDEKRLQELQSVAIRLVRFQVLWEEIESSPGNYHWELWDKRFKRLQKFGLIPLVVINASPQWARAPDDRENPWAPPVDPSDMVPFLKAFARRYGDEVIFYQIWDEPNIAPHWGAREANPYEYVRLLEIASSAIREVDTSAIILSAGLAPTLDPGRVNRNDLAYLDELLGLGAAMWFDILAWEPYGFEDSPRIPPDVSRLNFRRIELAHEILRKYGLNEMPIWATAFGWNAPMQNTSSAWGAVSEEEQATYAREAIQWRNEHASWLETLIWTHAFPDAPVTDSIWGFALQTPDGRKRPVWDVLTNAARLSSTAARKERSPASPPQHNIRYPLLLGSPGTTREFSVSGGDVYITVLTGPRWHSIWVDIDGQPALVLPHTAEGKSYLNLYSQQLSVLRVRVAHNLSPGTHVLHLTSGKGDPIWPILAVTTLPSDTTARAFPYILVGLLLLGAGFLLSITVLSVELHFPPLHKWEDLLVLLAAFCIPLTTRFVHVKDYTLVLPELPLILLAVVWGGRCWIQRCCTFRFRAPLSLRTTLRLWFAGFAFAVLIVNIQFAVDRQAMWANIKSTLLFPLLFYLFVAQTNNKTKKRIAYALIASVVTISVWGIVASLTSIWFTATLPRLQLFFDSPNHLALVLVRTLPFVLTLPSSIKPGRIRHFLPALLLVALLLTRSRGAWLLGVPTALFVTHPRFTETHRGRMLALSTVILGALLMVIRGVDTFVQRLYIWAGTWNVIRDWPWQGIGLGQFPWWYSRYALPNAWDEPLLYHGHNVILTTAAVGGIPLTILLAILLAHQLVSAPTHDLARAAKASLVAGLAFGLVDAFWSLPDLAYMTALGLALLHPDAEQSPEMEKVLE